MLRKTKGADVLFRIIQATVTANRDDLHTTNCNVQMYRIAANLVLATSYVEQVR